METAVKGNVKFIKQVEMDKYEARIYAVDTDDELDDFIKNSNAIIYTARRRFINLHNAGKYEWDTDGDGDEIEVIQGYDFSDDITRFQNVIDKVHGEGEYKVFALNIYDHSGIVFNINENKDSGWDSGCIGFIALPFVNKSGTTITVDNKADVANYLTDLWEGYYAYRIYDNEEGEFVWDDDVYEYLHSGNYKEFTKQKEALEETYGVNFKDAKRYY